MAATLLLTVGSALVGARQLLADTEGSLNDAREQVERADAQDRKRAFEAGFVRALCLVNTVADGQDHLHQGVKACEDALGLYGVLERDDWQQQPAW